MQSRFGMRESALKIPRKKNPRRLVVTVIEEQELMRPDFRRSELNEGQVEMKVDDDAHSIVPESTSAYVQKNSVTASGPSDNLLQQNCCGW